jgi:CheY-like chemotaxis protein
VQRASVLIVDDERLFRQTVVSFLEAMLPGVQILEAANGAEALAVLSARPVDVLLTDLQMPVMGGVGLLTELLNRGIQCSVIITTAYATPEVSRWALSSRAFALLEKPVELTQLEATVRSLLDPVETSRVEGVTLAGICQLLQMERKNCQVRVTSKEGKGLLSFVEGRLVDAIHERAEGDIAALDIFLWRTTSIEISGRIAPRSQTVFQDIKFLLMEAARITDERAHAGQPSPMLSDWAESSSPAADPSPSESGAFEETAPTPTPLSAGPIPTESYGKPLSPAVPSRSKNMANIKQSFSKIVALDGFIGVSLVDTESGMSLGSEGGGNLNLDVAAASNSEVVRAKRKAINALGLDDRIEDILISLGKQYHLIRPLRDRPTYFFYLAMDRARGNLALARAVLAEAEKSVEF